MLNDDGKASKGNWEAFNLQGNAEALDGDGKGLKKDGEALRSDQRRLKTTNIKGRQSIVK